jgi:hypothetical protein
MGAKLEVKLARQPYSAAHATITNHRLWCTVCPRHMYIQQSSGSLSTAEGIATCTLCLRCSTTHHIHATSQGVTDLSMCRTGSTRTASASHPDMAQRPQITPAASEAQRLAAKSSGRLAEAALAYSHCPDAHAPLCRLSQTPGHHHCRPPHRRSS